MLNLFPIQFLSLLAYFILRVFIGVIFLTLGSRHFNLRHELTTSLTEVTGAWVSPRIWLLILVEILIGTLFIIGLLTQLAAVLTMVLVSFVLFSQKLRSHPSIPPQIFYVLVLGTALSLFITGAGAFAFDLPI